MTVELDGPEQGLIHTPHNLLFVLLFPIFCFQRSAGWIVQLVGIEEYFFRYWVCAAPIRVEHYSFHKNLCKKWHDIINKMTWYADQVVQGFLGHPLS